MQAQQGGELPNPGTPIATSAPPAESGSGDDTWGCQAAPPQAWQEEDLCFGLDSARPPTHVMRRLAESIKRLGV